MEELLEWHVRLGHIPMTRLPSLETEGALPSRLAGCKVYGKLTTKAWRFKGYASHIGEDVTI
jgi:hypothetical protein